jgi:ornithine cyclodeaminase
MYKHYFTPLLMYLFVIIHALNIYIKEVVFMRVITIDDLSNIVKKHTFDQFMKDLIGYIKEDFINWEKFEKMPRPAIHVENGVIEVMPTANDEYYTFKYVNGHPKNTHKDKFTVIGTGQISNVEDGYPILFSEMTVLTAFRTAATSALGIDALSRNDSNTIAIIGTGAQSEFQILASRLVRNLKKVKYFDIDQAAMNKFKLNM